MKEKAIVLLSGGLDSTTCLAVALNKGYDVYTISFDYGQKQSYELELAALNSKEMGAVEHKTVRVDNTFFQTSALANTDIEVPKDKLAEHEGQIPITYVPARNTIFLSYALAYAEFLRCNKIYIGVNAVDYSGYPDCRPEFVQAFENLANLAVKEAVEGTIKISIETPLLNITKAEIIKLGKSLGVNYSKTLTCYDPVDGKACGKCDSCLLRKKGFADAGVKDETIYTDK